MSMAQEGRADKKWMIGRQLESHDNAVRNVEFSQFGQRPLPSWVPSINKAISRTAGADRVRQVRLSAGAGDAHAEAREIAVPKYGIFGSDRSTDSIAVG